MTSSTWREPDDAYKERILEVMPEGHTYHAEDLGNASGDEVDALGAKYGVQRKGVEPPTEDSLWTSVHPHPLNGAEWERRYLGFTLSVWQSHYDVRHSNFQACIEINEVSANGKPDYPTLTEAQQAAERMAERVHRAVLKHAGKTS